MPDLNVVTPAPSSRLEALVDDYLAHCRAKGLSPKTIRDNYGESAAGRTVSKCRKRSRDRASLALLCGRHINITSD
jgi:hypothetical protein